MWSITMPYCAVVMKLFSTLNVFDPTFFRSHVFHSRLYQPMSPCAIKLHLIRLLQNALYCVLCGCSPVGHESQESLKIFLKYTKMRKQGLPRLAPRPQVIEHSWPCDFPQSFKFIPSQCLVNECVTESSHLGA